MLPIRILWFTLRFCSVYFTTPHKRNANRKTQVEPSEKKGRLLARSQTSRKMVIQPGLSARTGQKKPD